MKTLQISDFDTLPIEFLSLRNVVYGGSGAGKTAFGRVIFEESIKAGIPCGVIDLKADWWGLKSSADGKNDGIPVVIFGGDHADLPIHENGGAELAEIVAELRQPFIVDLENFSKGKQLKFLAPFFDRLYDKNRHPLKLICDESDRYIPQRILTKDPNAAICLGAGEDIAKRGRKHGIFAMFISQRNADLNKSVTELCDVATVFRTSGPNDQKAVNDWFEAKGSVISEEQRAQVMREIAGLENGEAFFCSAHPHLKMFKKVRLRMPATFDSSATPEIGKELLQPKKFAKIDLEALGERMKATMEEAKAKDPMVLKNRIAQLEAGLNAAIKLNDSRAKRIEELLAKPSASPAKEVIKEVPVLTDDDRDLIEEATGNFEALRKNVLEYLSEAQHLVDPLNRLETRASEKFLSFVKNVQPLQPPKPVRTFSRPIPKLITTRDPAHPGYENGALPKGPSRVLTCLIQFPNGVDGNQITVLTGYTRRTRDSYIQVLREFGYSDRAGELHIATDSGRAALPDAEPLPTGEDLQNYWLQKLPQGERRCFEALLAAYPNSISKDAVSEQTGYTRRTRDSYLYALRAKELFTEPSRGEVRASDQLFQ